MTCDDRLYLRLNRSTKREAEKRAKALGYTLSQYIRYVIILAESLDIPRRKP